MMQGSVSGVGGDTLAYTVSATGGAVILEPSSLADFGTWVLTRYVYDSPWSPDFYTTLGPDTLVSGTVLATGVSGQSPLQVYFDLGDGTNAPLDSSQLYAYTFTTSNGTIQTPPLSPACSILIEQDHVSSILYRALQSGVAALALPASFRNKPQVIHAMPLAGAGMPVLPSISFNETLVQSTDYRIGEDVDTDSTINQFQVATQALRHFTVFVMAANVQEREFYKDAVIAIFSSMLPILNKIGVNVTHRFQASTGQLTGRSNEPGYYFAEILLEFIGLYTVGITTSYGMIKYFSFDPVGVEETILLT